MKKYKIYIFLLIIPILTNCIDVSEKIEINKERLTQSIERSRISQAELWKGGYKVLQLTDDNGSQSEFSVNNNHEILNIISAGYDFEKLGNSNKCKLISSDSVFLFDCILLEGLRSSVIDSLGDIDQWDRERINVWLKNKSIAE